VLPGRPTPPTCRFRSSCAVWFKAGRSICLTEAGRRPGSPSCWRPEQFGEADHHQQHPPHAGRLGALGLRLPDRGNAGHGNNTGRKCGLQLLLRHHTPLRTKRGWIEPVKGILGLAWDGRSVWGHSSDGPFPGAMADCCA
jgi:hypothetical protein